MADSQAILTIVQFVDFNEFQVSSKKTLERILESCGLRLGKSPNNPFSIVARSRAVDGLQTLLFRLSRSGERIYNVYNWSSAFAPLACS